MSLILDALNRSRQDVGQVPGLASQHYSEQEESADRRGYLPWLGLLAALLVIAWLLLDRGPAEDVSPVAAVPAPAPLPPTAAPTSPAPAAQAPQPAAAPPAPPTVAEAVAPAAPPAPPPTVDKAAQSRNSAIADLYTQSAATPSAAQGGANKQPAAAAVPAQAPPKAAPAPEPSLQKTQEQPIDIEKMVLQAREEMENARLEEHPAPFITDLSQQTKDAIPTIFYERHDYSGDAARSSVVLNGKKVKVGGGAAAGVKVEEILPDSVVLNHRGTQFRLRALNSWVNL